MRLIASFVLFAVLTGCRYEVASFTIASTQNVNYPKVMDARRFGATGLREGTTREHWLLSCIPIVGWPARIDQAIADASGGGADCMVEVRVVRWWWTALVYGQQGFTVYGTPLNTYAITPSAEDFERKAQGKTP